MAKDINKLKFNLTSDMIELLLKYNNTKYKYNMTKDENLLKQLESMRKKFIKEFQTNNKLEIEEYLKTISEKKD